MSGNTSATGGPLLPAATPAPLEGQALSDLVQGWVVGVTGLPGTNVRPRWQPEPADLPTNPTYWAAIGITRRERLGLPQVAHDSTGDGTDQMVQQEHLELECSFFDVGAGGQADYYAALLRDGVFVAQNREVLTLAGFDVFDVGDLVTAPTLLKQRWYYRVDLTITLTRAIARTYPVLNVLSAPVTVVTDTGVTDALTAPPVGRPAATETP